MTLYLVVETFTQGAGPVYKRFNERGRMAPDGVTYAGSWVTTDGRKCYQLMETHDRALLDEWMRNWSDIVRFEVITVLSSQEAAERFSPATTDQ